MRPTDRKPALTATVNHLINRLPRKDRLRLMSVLEPFDLVLGEVLCESGEPTSHVYFPTKGYISLVAQTEGSPGVEVGMVGTEGMLGAELALIVTTSPLHALVQGEGSALRLGTRDFKNELERSLPLQRCLHRYLYVLMGQQTTSATCLRFHEIGPRLARWLLMSQDRAKSDSFSVTQEFLGYMLGVRRVGVTTAASALQRSGLVKYHRGHITVLDRSGLKAAACSCYVENGQAYAKLLP
jgi:CRP-like cAMP-binding protein